MRKFSTTILTFLLLILPGASVYASVYENQDTNYEVIIDDQADLLTDAEEADLLEDMKPITEYGNVAFVSISDNPYHSTETFAREFYRQYFAQNSGTVFLIDMDHRYIWIHSDGAVYKRITTSYANTITDNVYSYASDQDYYDCASNAYEQIYTLLEGGKIAQPMKYICNLLLAIILALLINFFIVMWYSRSKKASTSEVLTGIYHKVDILNPTVNHTHQTKRYSPQSSGSSGGHSGGGGGGGGRSGGGGGHSF